MFGIVGCLGIYFVVVVTFLGFWWLSASIATGRMSTSWNSAESKSRQVKADQHRASHIIIIIFFFFFFFWGGGGGQWFGLAKARVYFGYLFNTIILLFSVYVFGYACMINIVVPSLLHKACPAK